MFRLVVALLVCLCVFTFGYFVVRFFNLKKENSFSTMNCENDSAKQAGLAKWRGGVRYPAGYFKTEEDFYKIEKKLRYHK